MHEFNEVEDAEAAASTRWLGPRQRLIAGIILAIGIGVAAWFAFGNENSSVAADEVSFTINGSESVSLTFNLTKPKNAAVTCVAEALSHNFLQVGYQELEFGPATAEKQQFTTTIPTTERAVTAVVKYCLSQ
ncbi:hypothetical protein GCM10010401_04040 [Rarobacter faecitabidus]|uniref:Uncharacterized protein DUF4307 n=1 Tax=Rarobacter faecitabidus TaxID=13243 RepID=A0A542ZUG8_RARFA|nr:DUF4307 domain-containing protein [Rarobacter faecitabidus]TQL63840.1 uncharacterized protein DUF4307 [Rarobacter faecitabidus]